MLLLRFLTQGSGLLLLELLTQMSTYIKKKHHYSIIQHQHMAAFKKSNPTCMLVEVSYGVSQHSHPLSYILYCYRVKTKFLTWMHYCTSFRKKKGNLFHVSDKLTVLLLVLSLHQVLSSYGFFSVSPFCKNMFASASHFLIFVNPVLKEKVISLANSKLICQLFVLPHYR